MYAWARSYKNACFSVSSYEECIITWESPEIFRTFLKVALQVQTSIPCSETSPLVPYFLHQGLTGWVFPELQTWTMWTEWIGPCSEGSGLTEFEKNGLQDTYSPCRNSTIPNEGISILLSLSGSAGWVIPEPSFLKRQHAVDLRGAMASCNVYHLTRVKVSPSQLKEIDHARCWFAPKAGGEQISRWVQSCPLISIWKHGSPHGCRTCVGQMSRTPRSPSKKQLGTIITTYKWI